MDTSDEEAVCPKSLSLKRARLFTRTHYRSLYFALTAPPVGSAFDRYFVSLALSLCSLNPQNVSGRCAFRSSRHSGALKQPVKHIDRCRS
jgi:hypothetical protein